MSYRNYTVNRWPHMPYTRVIQAECAKCEEQRRCFTHVDYPGLTICEDCFDDLTPPVDDGDHSNHWRHADWDSVAAALGREVVPHGVMQDGVYYPAGTNPPHNRPISNHYLMGKEPLAYRREVVRQGLARLKT